MRPDGCTSGRECLGCLRGALEENVSLEALCARFISPSRNGRNNTKALESVERFKSFAFKALVRSVGVQILEFFLGAAGPFHLHALDLRSLAQPESQRRFRLRKIARPALHHARLRLPIVKNAHQRADSVAVRFRTDQMKANAAISSGVLVAIKISGAVVGGQQDVEIAVAIEVSVGQAAAYFGLREAATDIRSDVAEFPAAFVQKKLRRLRVADVAVNVAHGLFDVPVGDEQVQSAVKVHVEEGATETESALRRQANAGGEGNVVVASRAYGAIQANHLIVEIGDGDSGLAGIFEVGHVHAHTGARLTFGAEGQARFHCDVLEFALA